MIIVANQELPTLRSASRLAAMLRQRCGASGSSWRSAASTPSRKSAARTSSGCSAGPINYTFPSDYGDDVGALNKGEPLVSSLAGSWR